MILYHIINKLQI